jgi:hypothetical protein
MAAEAEVDLLKAKLNDLERRRAADRAAAVVGAAGPKISPGKFSAYRTLSPTAATALVTASGVSPTRRNFRPTTAPTSTMTAAAMASPPRSSSATRTGAGKKSGGGREISRKKLGTSASSPALGGRITGSYLLFLYFYIISNVCRLYAFTSD